MIRSRLFAFKKVHRFANIWNLWVIWQKQKIFEDKNNNSPDSETSMLWYRALSILEDNPREAEILYRDLTWTIAHTRKECFHLAVATRVCYGAWFCIDAVWKSSIDAAWPERSFNSLSFIWRSSRNCNKQRIGQYLWNKRNDLLALQANIGN